MVRAMGEELCVCVGGLIKLVSRTEKRPATLDGFSKGRGSMVGVGNHAAFLTFAPDPRNMETQEILVVPSIPSKFKYVPVHKTGAPWGIELVPRGDIGCVSTVTTMTSQSISWARSKFAASRPVSVIIVSFCEYESDKGRGSGLL